jgi:hypothetical protein
MARGLRSVLITDLQVGDSFVQKIGSDADSDHVERRLWDKWNTIVRELRGFPCAEEGSGLLALFESNSAAIEAALRFHISVHEKANPSDVKVRSAVHCGEIDTGDENQITNGHSATFSRRLLESAGSAQILMTGRVYQDVRSVLPARVQGRHVEWYSHGYYGVDDAGVPTTIFEVRPYSDTRWHRPQPLVGFTKLTCAPYDVTEILTRFQALQDRMRKYPPELVSLRIDERVEFAFEVLLEHLDSILGAVANGPVLCSLKVPSGKTFECRYRRFGTDLYRALGVKIDEMKSLIPKINVRTSYSGRAMKTGKCIIVPRFAEADATSPSHQRPAWSKRLQTALAQFGLIGAAVCPVYPPPSVGVEQQPLLVLKVDLFEGHGVLADDAFTRSILWMAADYIGTRLGPLFPAPHRRLDHGAT